MKNARPSAARSQIWRRHRPNCRCGDRLFAGGRYALLADHRKARSPSGKCHAKVSSVRAIMVIRITRYAHPPSIELRMAGECGSSTKVSRAGDRSRSASRIVSTTGKSMPSFSFCHRIRPRIARRPSRRRSRRVGGKMVEKPASQQFDGHGWSPFPPRWPRSSSGGGKMAEAQRGGR
ncbi:hypothetical protein LCGC14_0510940 [marine sediment metagenome]|uniref:Uncharacterized protein n=1 Tax=marine sediment metagenome TaxID=412755 RepID=A0A0F9SJP6_9ZZZZ